jgi:hypothetical protein
MFKYTAVIIEPREHKALEFVLHNFFENLSTDWGFIIIHGRANKGFLDNLFLKGLAQYKQRVDKFIELDTINLTVEQYNNLLKTSSLYKCIDTELLLFFQTDTLVLNKDLINLFLEYDYIGAPWNWNRQVGNGGLSLRRKSKMIEICDNVDKNLISNEDLYFCFQNKIELKKPIFEEAQKFSVETVFHEKSFGIHAPWKHLNEYEMELLITKYPDIKKLIELNK